MKTMHSSPLVEVRKEPPGSAKDGKPNAAKTAADKTPTEKTAIPPKAIGISSGTSNEKNRDSGKA